MPRYSIALFSVATVFVVSIASAVTAVDLSAVVSVKRNGIICKRLLRTHEAENENDERAGFGGLIQEGTSKVKDFITTKKYKSLVNRLQLGDDFLDSVKSPQLERLNKLVTKFNRNKDQENQLSLIGPLSAKYGDDTVATMLVDLKKNPELAKLAKQLQDQQLTDWLKNGKSGGDIFSLLKLKDDGNIGSQKLQVLEDYLTIVNTKKSTDETLLNVLTKGFGGESNLVPLLAKAGIDPLMVDKSKKLEAALLTKWRDDNVPRLTVWVRLKFDDNLDEALSSGKMDHEISEIKKITAKYGEFAVAKALASAKDDQLMKDLAMKLQSLQLESWLANRKSAANVFTLLQIKHDGGSMKTWKMETLREYIQLFNSKTPQDKTKMFDVLRNGFGDGDGALARVVTKALTLADSPQMAAQYQSALFRRWVRSEIEPRSIYARFLNVDEASANFLERSIVAQYKAYYDDVKNPPQAVTFHDPRRS
ncbi:hypothetical protein AM587_10006509 [Phytophthora nicotianae]|uniref:RxLR effector protein n=1 Tax=Phytophthora nicotianae TaxID=4792 RepID=A0A0W8BY85_PHYNI|nr:hypothetical protein AM587_10006509 [Phytophthora nicotianae]